VEGVDVKLEATMIAIGEAVEEMVKAKHVRGRGSRLCKTCGLF